MPPSSDRRLRRVLVITGDPSLPDPTKWDGRYSDDDLELHRAMREALESLPGYEFRFTADHEGLVELLRRDPPELVLNFCDTGFRNVATQEIHVPALLEILGIPYSGAPPACMVLCYDKALVRLVAVSLGVPVPAETYLPPGRALDEDAIAYPALIKPAEGDGSVGITRDAVVHDADRARRYLEWFRAEFPGRAALVQEYLPGPEYGLALVGNPHTKLEALPPLEVDFSALPEGLPPILAFESKTGPEQAYASVGIRPARLPAATVATLERRASLLFERLRCRDYARFDFRTDARGEIRLMEVNPNPAWSATAKLAQMAAFAGIDYPGLLERILQAARARLAAG